MDVRELCKKMSTQVRVITDESPPTDELKTKRDPLAQTFECKYCGTPFDSHRELLQHEFNNPHERYLQRVSGDYKCMMCQTVFKTKSEYLAHWDDRSHRGRAAAEFFVPASLLRHDDTGRWLTQPTERDRINNRIRWDIKYRKVRWGIGAADEFEEQLDYAPKYKSFIVSEWYGESESGKSSCVLTVILDHMIPRSRIKLAHDWMEKRVENRMAAEIKREELTTEASRPSLTESAIYCMKEIGAWREPRIFFTFQVAQTVHILQNIARPHDHIMQDEDKYLQGTGRDSTIKKLQTTLKLARAKQVNFHFISPSAITYLENVNLSIYIWAKELPLTKRTTRAIMFNTDDDSMGIIQVKIIEEDAHVVSTAEFEVGQIKPLREIRESVIRDPERKIPVEKQDALLAGEDVQLPIMTVYELYKYDNLDQTLEDGGADSWTFSIEDLERDGRRAAETIIEMKGLEAAQGYTKDYIIFLMSSKEVGIRDFGAYQKYVGAHAYEYIKAYLSEEEEEEEVGGVGEEETGPTTPSMFSTEDESYFDYIEDEIRAGKLDLHVTGSRLTALQVWDAYKKYHFQHSDYQDLRAVAEQLGMKSHTQFSMGKKSTGPFKRIKGRLAELKGGLLEVEMLRRYAECERVDRLVPSPRGFKYPDDIAGPGEPDRIVYLLDGTVRICAWKHYDKNATIELWRDGHFCPEVLAARRLIERGMPEERVKVVVEGVMKGEFFSKEIDPFAEEKSVTVYKRDRSAWPPDLEKILRVKSND